MKKQALAIAIASALAAPSAYAAQDTAGMHYTSAAEGFYASIRARLDTSGDDISGSHIGNSSSRIGIRGTNDLGGGLEGFYTYEIGVDIDNGSDLSTRMGHVGLRGPFGSFWVGTNWSADYNWTHGSTDVANVASGNLDYTANRPGRTSNAIEYTTPDLNGFQGAFRVNVSNSGADSSLTVAPGDADGENATTVGNDEVTDDNDIDSWNLAANYGVQGFTVAGAYNVRPDGYTDVDGVMGATEDANAWTFKLGYTQDNWYVNGWYGEDNTSDSGMMLEDTTLFSLAGGVSVDKVNLYALYDQRENATKQEDSWGTLGAQYNLGSRSRVWIEYVSRDLDTDTNADDYVNIGMRHDF